MRLPRSETMGGAGAVVALSILAWPNVALANAGTPLMWAPVYHLLFANLLIGVGEGWVIGRVFGIGRPKVIGVMIAANYASSIVGAIALYWLGDSVRSWLGAEALFYSLPLALGALGVATFVASVLVEWPFCLVLLRRRVNAVWKSLGATAAVHLLSYAALVALYLGSSNVSLYTEVDVSDRFVPSLEPIAEVLFVSSEDGDLYRIALDGSGRERLRELDEPCDGLFAQLDAAAGVYRICTWRDEAPFDLGIEFSASDYDVVTRGAESRWGQQVLDMRGKEDREDDRDWTVRTDLRARGGLFAYRRDERLNVVLEVPTTAWYTRHATVLPGDLVVYEMGPQIVVLDLNRRAIGFLAAGTRPLVLLRAEPATKVVGASDSK